MAIDRNWQDEHVHLRCETFARGPTLAEVHIVPDLSVILLRELVKTDCERLQVYPRLRIGDDCRYTFPEMMVTCRTPDAGDDGNNSSEKPQVIFELFAESQANYHREWRLKQYRTIPSLREYVLLSQDQPYIQRFSRSDGDRWISTDATGLDATMEIPTIGCQLALAEVYAKVEFSEAE